MLRHASTERATNGAGATLEGGVDLRGAGPTVTFLAPVQLQPMSQY